MTKSSASIPKVLAFKQQSVSVWIAWMGGCLTYRRCVPHDIHTSALTLSLRYFFCVRNQIFTTFYTLKWILRNICDINYIQIYSIILNHIYRGVARQTMKIPKLIWALLKLQLQFHDDASAIFKHHAGQSTDRMHYQSIIMTVCYVNTIIMKITSHHYDFNTSRSHHVHTNTSCWKIISFPSVSFHRE